MRHEIHRGATATVYEAAGPNRSAVALKVLNQTATIHETYVARLRREVQAADIASPYMPRLLDSHIEAEPYYLAFDLVKGPTLGEYVRSYGPLPEASLYQFAWDLANGIRTIHAGRYAHRDLSPTNVILSTHGLRIVDFGLAVEDVQEAQVGQLTSTGTVLGTPPWRSPEQARGEPSDRRSDIFNWGSLVAYAASGRAPFGVGETAEVTPRILEENPRIQCPSGLEPIVRWAMAKRADERPPADDLVQSLRRVLPASVELQPPAPARDEVGPRSPLSPRNLAIIGVAAVVMIALLVGWSLRRDSSPAEPAQGALEVSTDPPVPARLSLGGVELGSSRFSGAVPVGTQWLCFDLVPGFVPPPCQLVTVGADRPVVTSGTFTPEAATSAPAYTAGWVEVGVRPPLAKTIVCVNGHPLGRPRPSTPDSDTATLLIRLQQGTYDVSFGSVEGYVSPSPERVPVDPGGLRKVPGEFKPSGSAPAPAGDALAPGSGSPVCTHGGAPAAGDSSRSTLVS